MEHPGDMVSMSHNALYAFPSPRQHQSSTLPHRASGTSVTPLSSLPVPGWLLTRTHDTGTPGSGRTAAGFLPRNLDRTPGTSRRAGPPHPP
jgi:hypothetical protein